jgi:hypothetical protein
MAVEKPEWKKAPMQDEHKGNSVFCTLSDGNDK